MQTWDDKTFSKTYVPPYPNIERGGDKEVHLIKSRIRFYTRILYLFVVSNFYSRRDFHSYGLYIICRCFFFFVGEKTVYHKTLTCSSVVTIHSRVNTPVTERKIFVINMNMKYLLHRMLHFQQICLTQYHLVWDKNSTQMNINRKY